MQLIGRRAVIGFGDFAMRAIPLQQAVVRLALGQIARGTVARQLDFARGATVCRG